MSRVAYANDIQPAPHLQILRDYIVLLDKCVSAARSYQEQSNDKKTAASLNLTVGFGLLAMSEARAALMLLSIGLERSARIHLRALYEYNLRARLVQNKDTARAFMLAAGYEAREYAKSMQWPDERVLQADRRFLGDAEAGEKAQRERDALGGNVKALIRETAGSVRDYALYFVFPSQYSHGSILALYEVSVAAQGKQQDFGEASFRDGLGKVQLLFAALQVLLLTALLIDTFGIDVNQEWDTLDARLKALAEQTPDQPADTHGA